MLWEDAQSQREISMGILAFLTLEKKPIASDIPSFSNMIVKLDISQSERVSSYVKARSSLMEEIVAQQFDDLQLQTI